MKNIGMIEKLKNQSTWRLAGFSIITYGVYFAYYISTQTKEINALVEGEDAISSGFISSLFVMSYSSLFLFIAYMFVDEGSLVDGSLIEGLSGLVDMIVSIMMIIWGFKARNRVNAYCDLEGEGDVWFHGFWTFLFSPMYFNYKVNCIYEDRVEQADSEGL